MNAVASAGAVLDAPSCLPVPEFLEYEPLDDGEWLSDSLDAPVIPQPIVSSANDDWSMPAENALEDPFSALWSSGAAVVLPQSGVEGASAKRAHVEEDARDTLRCGDESYDQMPVKRTRGVATFTAYEVNTGASARTLPACAIRVLKDWMMSPEHFDHPYPDDKEKVELAAKAGITVKQLTIWFTNARKRIWVPMRKSKVRAVLPHAVDRVCVY